MSEFIENQENPKKRKYSPAKLTVYTATIAALMLAGQLALRWAANVEVVTLITMVSAFIFPPGVTICAVLVFCTGQGIIYGFAYWTIAYYIYWVALTAVSLSLKKIKRIVLRNVIAVIIAVVFTVLFGFLTTLIDSLAAAGFTKEFPLTFYVMYMQGAYYYLTHFLSSLISVAVLFTPLTLALKNTVKV